MITKRADAEKQLNSFIDKFEPKHQILIRAVRKTLRRRFPTAHELVYDNYNFFVIGYCPTERPSDCIFQLPRLRTVLAFVLCTEPVFPTPKRSFSAPVSRLDLFDSNRQAY